MNPIFSYLDIITFAHSRRSIITGEGTLPSKDTPTSVIKVKEDSVKIFEDKNQSSNYVYLHREKYNACGIHRRNDHLDSFIKTK